MRICFKKLENMNDTTWVICLCDLSDIVVVPVWQHAHSHLLSPFPPVLVAIVSRWDISQSPRPKTQLAVWDFQLLTTVECKAEWRHSLLSLMIKRWKVRGQALILEEASHFVHYFLFPLPDFIQRLTAEIFLPPSLPSTLLATLLQYSCGSIK